MLHYLTSDHINEAVQLFHDMHDESDFKRISYSPDYMALALQNAIKCPHYLVIGDIQNNKLVGIMVARIESFVFSLDDRLAQDVALYVIPEKRGTLTAIRLLKEYISWARVHGVKRICLGISTGINDIKTDKLYTGLGFTKFASNYKMEIQ